MDLKDILSLEAIRAGVKVQSKKRLLQDIAEHAAACYGLDPDAVCAALTERENLGPTGVGHGVAIPHARLGEVQQVCGLFTSLDVPVDFTAVDRKPVDLVFTLLAPKGAGAEHLKALARVSRTLRNPSICEKLRSTSDTNAVYAVLIDEAAAKAA
ncbi:MAG: PTS sugar transporter subunit IIA [Pseudomonadota bacterium]